MKIDIIYTWVDGSENKWLNKKNETIKSLLNNKNIKNNFGEFAFVNGRFRNSNEIIYSIRSVEKYINKNIIGNIYIVTDNQKNNLLNENKVIYIDHKDIIKKENLPTYNSTKIVSNLFKIKNLSNIFLYFNDDILLGPKFKINDLYDFDNHITKIQFDEKENTFPSYVAINSNKALKKHFLNIDNKYKEYLKLNFTHGPKIINKEIFNNMINLFYEEYLFLQKQTLRNKETVVIGDLYYRYLQCINSTQINKLKNMIIMTQNKKEDFTELINNFENLSYFCINDCTDNNFELNEKLNAIEEVLQFLYPQKSSYEI